MEVIRAAAHKGVEVKDLEFGTQDHNVYFFKRHSFVLQMEQSVNFGQYADT